MPLLDRILFPRPRLSDARLRRAVGGRTVLLTGASFGIGEALALLLGRAGAALILVARTADKLDAVCDAVVAAGGQAMAVACDLTDPAAVEALIAALPPVDILVSNAGKSIRRGFWASTGRPQDVGRTIALNYTAPARLVSALGPGLRDRGGQVVSVAAANLLLPPPPGWAAYQASKAAFDQWLRAVRPELVAAGVAAGTAYLPLVRTRMIAPTAAYDRVPAMTPDHAARVIARLLVTRRAYWRPWWLFGAAAASAAIRPLWERVSVAWAKRHG
ncbi:SDR family NAD(P)-dependent oxidoreductase [Sphingomonas sp.]|uniref:SDR family NAD(P)-dependent oxidoreductase n=1 Tax=Sphingomonas sp. TaxID=28214 RepID=UPI003CC6348D